MLSLPIESTISQKMKCLRDRVMGIVSTQDNLQKEVNHLAGVLKHSGYPTNFFRSASTPPQELGFKSLEDQ